jgi:hypothetical protein
MTYVGLLNQLKKNLPIIIKPAEKEEVTLKLNKRKINEALRMEPHQMKNKKNNSYHSHYQ